MENNAYLEPLFDEVVDTCRPIIWFSDSNNHHFNSSQALNTKNHHSLS